MAINIFQGGKNSTSKPKKTVNSAQRSTRAKQAVAALVSPGVASDSGNTAVGKAGTLQKVGNVVGQVAGIASKFLPGLAGTIAGGISNILNDPEWWSHVPGDAVSLNSPLRLIAAGGQESTVAGTKLNIHKPRWALLEIESRDATSNVFRPTDVMVTNYLMPEIRKVVNAVPLQDASDYKDVLMIHANIYAAWRTLKKWDYMLKHGQTYMASFDDVAFPPLQVTNAAWLQSTINRLEEYLRSHVRLPHTLCEYLAWRFGRIYKSCASAKSALILYDSIEMSASISTISALLSNWISYTTATPARQKAATDLYNTYFDHDLWVDVPEHTQYTYDPKEFALRTNSDFAVVTTDDETPDVVYIDSSLDNPTVYMASTVSTIGYDGTQTSLLFPIKEARAWIPQLDGDANLYVGTNELGFGASAPFYQRVGATSKWRFIGIQRLKPGGISPASLDENDASLAVKVGVAIACKALDIYNKDIYVSVSHASTSTESPARIAVDITSLSMDMAEVPNTIIANEHVYAFANLVSIERKHSMSYKAAETLVAKDTANFIEKLDVATAK